MKKLLLILGEKEMDRYKISFGTSFLHSIIVRVASSTVTHSELKLEKKCNLKNMCLHDYLKG